MSPETAWSSSIKAPPSLWYKWKYLSTSDISKAMRQRIMLSYWMSMQDAEFVNRSLRWAKRYHGYLEEDKRSTWERYFEHKKWVLLIWLIENWCRDIHKLAARWLHDVIEDANATYEELQEWFWEEVARLVFLLTKPARPKPKDQMNDADKALYELELQHYYWAIGNDPEWAWIIKVDDWKHNSRTLIYSSNEGEPERENEKEKYTKNLIKLRKHVLPIARDIQAATKMPHYDNFCKDLDNAENRLWIRIDT